MKINFLSRAKFLLLGFIVVAIMLSVSLSFCAWDSVSVEKILSSNGSGQYIDKYKIVIDNNGNGLADVGDTIEYGNYYQSKSSMVKSPLRWIVADKIFNAQTQKYELSVITQNIIAYGSFYGVTYTKGSDWMDTLVGQPIGTYVGSQNYSISTVRTWLNFDGSDNYVRTDNGTLFSLNSKDGEIFKGFYNQAFTQSEKDNIIAKTISNMRGAAKYYDDVTVISQIENYSTVSDKVWLPSYTEIFGTGLNWQDCSDGSPNKQFEYFKNGASRIATTTDFASSHLGNYTIAGMQESWTANWNNTNSGEPGFWMTRSPDPERRRRIGSIDKQGNIMVDYWAVDSLYGIRPAIILPY